MIEWLDKLPLLLAGPMVRRVEPGLASVWIATREPCDVELAIYGGVVVSTAGRALFAGATPLFPTTRVPTLRIGAKLHLACVTATDVLLRPEQLYSYNITLHAADGRHDLASLGLLVNATGTEPPNLPLGYDDGALPAFTLPPNTLEHLIITHGSCRRANADGPDALAFLDDLVGRERNEPLRRPHQLFLTGDQIYADDVPRPLLPLCTTLGNYLLTGTLPVPDPAGDGLAPAAYAPAQLPTLEHLPTAYRDPTPVTHDNFTSVWREGLCIDQAKLTSTDYDSHVLSLGEFIGMYLLTYSPAVWPRGATWPADVTGADGTVLYRSGEPRFVGLVDSVVANPSGSCLMAHGGTGPPPVVTPPADELAAQKRRYVNHIAPMEELRQALPRVRRALANVPTYMILDDHEVTDDWNVTARWVADVNGAALGRAVLRNGLVAYALFQGWGSDPRYFGPDQPGGSVLAQIARLFPSGAVQPPAAAAVAELDTMFGLAGGPSQVRWDWTVDGPRHRVIALDARTRRAFTGPDNPPIIVPPTEIERQIPAGPLPAGLEVLVVLAPSPTVSMPLVDDFVQPLAVRVLDLTFALADPKARSRKRPGYLDKDFESWFVDPGNLDFLLRRLATYPRVVVLSGDVHHASSSALSYWRRGHAEPSRLASFTASALKNHAPDIIRGTVKVLALSERVWSLFTPFERLIWDQDFPRPIEVPSDIALPRALRAKLRRGPVIVPSTGWPAEAVQHREPDGAMRLEVVRDERPVEELPPAARTLTLAADIAPADGIRGLSQVAQRHQRALATEALTRAAVFAHNLGMVTFARELEDPGLPALGDPPLDPPGPREVLVARQTFFTLHPLAVPPDAADAYTVHRVVLDPFPPEQPPTIRFLGTVVQP